MLTYCTLFLRTPENSSRASSPSCSDYENFPMVPTLETSYLARAGKNEFLNLVPDIEEMRPGWVMPCLFLVVILMCAVMSFQNVNMRRILHPTKMDDPVFWSKQKLCELILTTEPGWFKLEENQILCHKNKPWLEFLFCSLSDLLCLRRVSWVSWSHAPTHGWSTLLLCAGPTSLSTTVTRTRWSGASWTSPQHRWNTVKTSRPCSRYSFKSCQYLIFNHCQQ